MSAKITIATVDFQIPACQNLKEKRRVVKHLLAVLHNRFNCSASEIECLDLWQRSTIAIVAVSNESDHSMSVIQSAVNELEKDPRLIINTISTETIS